MPKILDIMHVDPKDGTYGVEIEVGGTNLPPGIPNFWKATVDGSIKGSNEAVEYIFKGPMSYDKSVEAVLHLSDYFKKYGSVIDDNATAGVHVHVNVQNYSITDLFTLITLYHILEIPLLEFCGEYRSGNHFCLRATDAEEIIHTYYKIMKEKNFKFLNDNLRYSALNIVSLKKFGSVELRGMRTSKNFQDTIDWLGLVNRVVLSAKEFKTPLEIMEAISGDGYIPFARKVLKDQFKFIENIPGLDAKIKTGLRLIQPIANSSDWKEKANSNPFVKVEWA